MTCIACGGFPSKENDPCGLCGKYAHNFRHGLREIITVNGKKYAITNKGVLKNTGGRWRDAVFTESELRKLAKVMPNDKLRGE